jgi:hypothetical protein
MCQPENKIILPVDSNFRLFESPYNFVAYWGLKNSRGMPSSRVIGRPSPTKSGGIKMFFNWDRPLEIIHPDIVAECHNS